MSGKCVVWAEPRIIFGKVFPTAKKQFEQIYNLTLMKNLENRSKGSTAFLTPIRDEEHEEDGRRFRRLVFEEVFPDHEEFLEAKEHHEKEKGKIHNRFTRAMTKLRIEFVEEDEKTVKERDLK